jgi:putative ABC transport system permease protein
LGTPQAALGQRLNWEKWEPDSLHPVKQGKIIGVVKDFHVKSLHEKLSTTIIHIYPPVLAKIAVKVRTANFPLPLDLLNPPGINFHLNTRWIINSWMKILRPCTSPKIS